MIDQQFTYSKKLLTAYLTKYLQKKSHSFQRFSADRDYFDKLLEMTVAGKMYRGILILYLYELLSGKRADESVFIVASALELLQTGILIQDDVMDQGSMRRGLPSIHVHYATHLKNVSNENRVRLGESLATCIGDVAYFLAFELINSLSAKNNLNSRIIGLYSSEMVLLGLSQIEDVMMASRDNNVSGKEILKMYVGKTSRYSFILPLLTVSELLGKRNEWGVLFEEIGTLAGIVYQLVDDKIGLFGNEKTVGKSVSSDITEGKKTLYWFHALSTLQGKNKKEFVDLFGKKHLTHVQIDRVRELVVMSGAGKYVDEMISEYENKITQKIDLLPFSVKQRDDIQRLITFINKRNK